MKAEPPSHPAGLKARPGLEGVSPPTDLRSRPLGRGIHHEEAKGLDAVAITVQGTVRHRRGLPPAPAGRGGPAQGGDVRPARPGLSLAVRATRRQPDLGPDPRRDDDGRLPPPLRRGPDAPGDGSRSTRPSWPDCSGGVVRRAPRPGTSASSRGGSSRSTAARCPTRSKALTSFRGVGPKIAALTLAVGFGRPAIAVDIHVHRIANRWGYVATTTPEKTMLALAAKLPERYWIEINERLVPFGKFVCTGVAAQVLDLPAAVDVPAGRRDGSSIRDFPAGPSGRKRQTGGNSLVRKADGRRVLVIDAATRRRRELRRHPGQHRVIGQVRWGRRASYRLRHCRHSDFGPSGELRRPSDRKN